MFSRKKATFREVGRLTAQNASDVRIIRVPTARYFGEDRCLICVPELAEPTDVGLGKGER